jgi:hypothetical protein
MKLLLILSESFIVLITIISGGFMLTNPYLEGLDNVSNLIITSTPNFLFLSTLTILFVGLVNLIALFNFMQHHRNKYNWSIAGGLMILLWSIMKVILSKDIYWESFTYSSIGILIMLIAHQLKGKLIV